MANLPKIPLAARHRVQVQSTPTGYAIQVYGQTIIRSFHRQEALRLAARLRRALT